VSPILFWVFTVANLLGSVAFLAWSVRSRTVHALFWAGVLYSYEVPVVGDYFSGNVAIDILLHSAIFAFGFNVCYAAGQAGLYTRPRQEDNLQWANRIARPKSSAYALAGSLVFVVGVICLFASLGAIQKNIFDITWTEAHLESNDALYTFGVTCTLGASGFGVLLWVNKRRKALALFAVAWIVAVVLLRVRILLIPAMLPVVIVALNKPGKFIRKGLVVGCLGVCFLFAMGFVRSLRWAGSVTYDEGILTRGVDMAVGSNMDNYVRTDYYDLLQLVPDAHPYLRGDTFIRVLLLPIPWRLFPGLKPEDSMYVYARYLGSEIDGESVHPLVLGDAFANFGDAGVLLGLAYGGFLTLLQKYLESVSPERSIVALGPICTFITLIVRGSVYNASLFLVSGLLCVAIIGYGVGLPKRGLVRRYMRRPTARSIEALGEGAIR